MIHTCICHSINTPNNIGKQFTVMPHVGQGILWYQHCKKIFNSLMGYVVLFGAAWRNIIFLPNNPWWPIATTWYESAWNCIYKMLKSDVTRLSHFWNINHILDGWFARDIYTLCCLHNHVNTIFVFPRAFRARETKTLIHNTPLCWQLILSYYKCKSASMTNINKSYSVAQF